MTLRRLISLRGLLATTLAISALGGGAAVMVADASRGQSSLRSASGGPQHAARQLANRLEGALAVAGRDVTLAADNAILKPLSDPEAVRRYFGRWRALHPEYVDVLLADGTGRVQVTASGNFINADVSGTSWFARGLSRLVVGDATERSRAGTEAPRYIIVGAPISGNTPGAAGVLAVQMSPEWVDEAVELTRQSLGDAGRDLAFTVLNAAGRTVHQSGRRSPLPGDTPEATAAMSDTIGSTLGWLVTASKANQVADTAEFNGFAIVLVGFTTIFFGLLGWVLGGLISRGLVRIQQMAVADDPAIPTGQLIGGEIHRLAEAVSASASRRQGRDRIIQDMRAALSRSRDRLHAVKMLAGSTCWEIDIGRNQVMWTDGPQNGASSASERVCDLDEVLTRVEARDRDVLRMALRTAVSEPGTIRDIAVCALPTVGEETGQRLMLRIASKRPTGAAPPRLHVLSREIGIVALAAPAGPAVQTVEAGDNESSATERRTDLVTREIIDGIVHDVNNALTVVLTSLGMLKRDPAAGERTLQLVETAMRGAARGASLTRRVTALTRREAPPACETDAAAIVEDLVEFIRATLVPEMMVALSVAPDLPLLLCSERDFEIALLNLISDAKASLPAEETISLVVEATTSSSDLAIIKRPGVRVILSASSELVEGRGVASVRDLMEEIGGSVSVVISLQVATIALWFPATDVRRDPTVASKTGRRTLLLVESDPLLRMAMTEALTNLGHAVTPLASAAHAMDILAQRRDFDLMLCDYALPKTNGLSLASVVSRTHPMMQIVLMGARGHLPANAAVFRALHKPFGLEDLSILLNETPLLHEQAA